MLKKLALSLLLISGSVAFGQVSNPSIILVASAPSGACVINLPDEQVIGAGTLYSCQNLTWGQIGGGGGTGFPITLGSTPIPSGSTTTTLAGLTLTSPTLTTPALGTPASGIITNLTGTCTSCTANSATSIPAANVAAGTFPTGMTMLGAAEIGTAAEFSNGTCTTSKTITPSNGNMQNVTLTNGDTCALTFTQPSSGTASITLKIIQSTTSTFNGTISGCKWPGGTTPTITATTGAIDFVSVYLDGTNAYCAALQNFK